MENCPLRSGTYKAANRAHPLLPCQAGPFIRMLGFLLGGRGLFVESA